MTSDFESMQHASRFAFLAMAVRAVAGDQFEKTDSSEVDHVVIKVSRPESLGCFEMPVTVEFIYRGFVVGEVYL